MRVSTKGTRPDSPRPRSKPSVEPKTPPSSSGRCSKARSALDDAGACAGGGGSLGARTFAARTMRPARVDISGWSSCARP
ncbi:MAG: hypothetical protein M5U28_16075 [Sandaracinaceae bacterium]|nr:hypothetical protein [Sandaracinaceae bacterium]